MADTGGAAGGAVVGNGDGFLDGVGFWVTDSWKSPGNDAGGGFAMSTEQMQAELAEFREIRELLDKQIRTARPLESITTPGHDPASLRNTSASNNFGHYAIGHLRREAGYLDTLIEKMERALGITEQEDEQAGENVEKQGGELY